jgi:beta-RFAP synthase
VEIEPIAPSQALSSAEKQTAASGFVRVTATARLHFGFLDPSGRGSRPFGSFGLSLDAPRTRLTLEPAPAICAGGPGALRAQRYLEAIVESAGFDRGYMVKVEEEITPHAGLGSGTQLALAVGTAFSRLEGLGLSPQEIASRLGRGARSGIGIATFEHGGAVLDSGPRGGALPELVARVPFPEAWRAILIFDPSAEGLAGAGEMEAFERMPPFPERETDELWQRVTELALPAIAAGDFESFAEQVGYLQAVMGAYFAPLQGGPYLSQGVSDALRWLSGQGLNGLGQSSWGPTGFAFVSSEDEGWALLDGLRATRRDWKLRFALAKGRNEGALIQSAPHANR